LYSLVGGLFLVVGFSGWFFFCVFCFVCVRVWGFSFASVGLGFWGVFACVCFCVFFGCAWFASSVCVSWFLFLVGCLVGVAACLFGGFSLGLLFGWARCCACRVFFAAWFCIL